MKGRPLTIRTYIAPNGKAPFSEWINSLKDSRARAKIRIRLDRSRLGNLGDCKSAGMGVMELRIDYGPGYRVYFGIENKEMVILLIGGDKSSQHKDISRAQTFWADYRSR